MAEVAEIYILNRETYNNLVDLDEIDTYSMYFVREDTSENSKILSLYVGLARQCDVLDITKDAESWDTPIDFVDFANNYNIPVEYQIPNKLLFYKQDGYSEVQSGQTIQFTEDQYRLIMWYPGDNLEQGKFLDCGIPRTTIICPEDLPSVQHATLNNVYFRTKENYKSIYIFDGTNFVKIFDDNDYIKDASLLQVDNITILEDADHVISGVGANLSGKTINIGGTDYTASEGATIYNDYSGNKTVGTYSNVFGSGNTSQGNYSTVIGYGNTEKSSYPYGCNMVIGNGNTITSSNSQYNFIEGYQNQLSGSTSCFYNTIMGNNSVSGTNIIGNLIFGSHPLNSGSPSIAGNTIQYSLIGGNDNTFAGSSLSQSAILGTLNTVSNGAASYSNFIIGASNNAVLSTNIGCIVAGVGLSFNSTGNEGTTIIGKYNSSSSSYTDTLLVVGGGTSNSDRTDVLKLSTNGLLQISGPNGNAVTTNGVTIESRRATLSTINTDDASYTTAYLPSNGQELLLSNLYTVGSITITDITNMYYDNGSGSSNKAVSDDYNSVIIFKKGSTMTTAEDILTNFSSVSTDKIYLLNKDIDISSYTTLHVMLFNDGFHICAIVAGYDDTPAV